MEKELRVVRIVSGSPAAVESEVNELLKDYVPMQWAFGFDHTGSKVTCLMVSEQEWQKQMRMVQIAAMNSGAPRLKL